MAKDKVFDSDSDNFLLWCKATCDMNTASVQLLNLEDVGRFFSKKMEDGDLDVETLSPTGFELLQSYFLSSNENGGKITRIEKKEVQQRGYNMYSMGSDTYSYSYGSSKK